MEQGRQLEEKPDNQQPCSTLGEAISTYRQKALQASWDLLESTCCPTLREHHFRRIQLYDDARTELTEFLLLEYRKRCKDSLEALEFELPANLAELDHVASEHVHV